MQRFISLVIGTDAFLSRSALSKPGCFAPHSNGLKGNARKVGRVPSGRLHRKSAVSRDAGSVIRRIGFSKRLIDVPAFPVSSVPLISSSFKKVLLGEREHSIRNTSGRRIVGSFPPTVPALHRTACRNLSNLRTSTAPLPDCSDRAPPAPDLPPGPRRAALPAQHRVQ